MTGTLTKHGGVKAIEIEIIEKVVSKFSCDVLRDGELEALVKYIEWLDHELL